MKTAELLERLRRHYIKPGPMPGGVFVPECGRNGTTGGMSRCDALYVGFTSASGRLLVGHELKVSRSDWRHELDKPHKADAWSDQCHAWYVVAPSVEVVPPEELPAGWGLLTVNPRTKTRLDVTVKAKVHVERVPSWDTVRSIMARLDTLQAGQIREIEYDALEKARGEVGKQAAEHARRSARYDIERLERLISGVEEHLGVKLADYGRDTVKPERLGEALRLLEALDRVTRIRGLAPTIRDLAQLLDSLKVLEVSVEEFDGVYRLPAEAS